MLNIDNNKQIFTDLLRKVSRDGADIPGLIYKLEKKGFFTAPCSAKYHLNIEGGLCQHSLNVYYTLAKLNEAFETNLSEDSMIIVALCHDLDKMGKYEITSRNVKDYCANGKCEDALGKFNWKSEVGYAVKQAEDRFIYGHHGQNSEYMTGTFIPLSIEESAAITNHMGRNDEYNCFDATPIFNKFTLAAMLHLADSLSTFVIETGKSKIFECEVICD